MEEYLFSNVHMLSSRNAMKSDNHREETTKYIYIKFFPTEINI